MKIKIAERLHPFSHEMGTAFLLPKTSWSVRVFPTRLNFCDLAGNAEPFSLTFDFSGPIHGFTAELDLEQALLRVFGKTQKGYMRYELAAKEGSILLTMEKVPEKKVFCKRVSEEFALSSGESKSLCSCDEAKAASQERLSLGMHKAQDWDLVRRRLDCKEIFPHWLRLANLTPSVKDPLETTVGNHSLLGVCKNKIAQAEKQTVLEAFENLFRAAFEGVLVPRLVDTDYQGIAPEIGKIADSALPLLTESAKLIRSLFIQEKPTEIALLPCLPPQFHCGRFIGGVLDFEWSKKTLRRVLIDSPTEGEMHLKLPKGIRSFRLRLGRKSTAKGTVDAQGRAVLCLEGNRTAQLDRFEG